MAEIVGSIQKAAKEEIECTESGNEAQDTVQNGLWTKKNEDYGVNEKQSEKIVQTKKMKEIELERLECAKSTVQSEHRQNGRGSWKRMKKQKKMLEEDEETEKERKRQLIQLANSICLLSKK